MGGRVAIADYDMTIKGFASYKIYCPVEGNPYGYYYGKGGLPDFITRR